jgi:hypothetical protein
LLSQLAAEHVLFDGISALPKPVLPLKIRESITSWVDAQRQPAAPGKVAPFTGDVAEAATKRTQPRRVDLKERMTQRAYYNSG